MNAQEVVREFFTSYAYKPAYVYVGIFGFMYASAFGFPLPEEIVLLSAAFMAHTALNPDYGIPHGTPHVTPGVLALVAVLAVISSDVIIFELGRRYGRRILRSKWASTYFPPERLARIEDWSHRYGYWTSGIFRFTPGLRFPGHLFCGMSGMPLWKFLAVDGTAALLTIPPQIYLVSLYGDTILNKFKEFKLGLIACLVVGLGVWLNHQRRTRKIDLLPKPDKS
ncbi:MAG: DedA family protein [Bdellovibrionales bacterium]|nr:DedA family protein [Bdellovibrionales bacterium]